METTRSSHTREVAALITAGIVYWLTIYPRARREIRRWKRRAQQIPDPALRAGALEKLTRERLNPEAAAFFAALAPIRQRRQLIRLMVAFQIAYDYLDAINEQPDTAALRNGLHLHLALTDAVTQHPPRAVAFYYRHHPREADGGYLNELVELCQRTVFALPSTQAIQVVLVDAVTRCGEAQSRNHAVCIEDYEQLVRWSEAQPHAQGYLWWELAAGGISCLAIHALFAAAASDTTCHEAERIDAAYFPPICAISALLDSLIDYSDDAHTANHSFTSHYEDSGLASERFATITNEATALLSLLKNRYRHGVLLAGIACFYLSAPTAKSKFAQPVMTSTLACLGPITMPLLLVVRRMRRRTAT